MAVVPGRRGGEKPLPPARLSAAVLDARRQRLPGGEGVRGCISDGPTELADPHVQAGKVRSLCFP